MYSLLRFVAGSSFLYSFYSNLPNYFTSRDSASVFADFLRSHFFVSQLNALCRTAKGYLSELRRATFSEESHSSFCSPSLPLNFLWLSLTSFLSFATGSDKFAYFMLKHHPRSGMDFRTHHSKLFERIILSRLLFFLKSNSMLSSPGRFPPWTVCSRSNSVPFSVHFGWV